MQPRESCRDGAVNSYGGSESVKVLVVRWEREMVC